MGERKAESCLAPQDCRLQCLADDYPVCAGIGAWWDGVCNSGELDHDPGDQLLSGCHDLVADCGLYFSDRSAGDIDPDQHDCPAVQFDPVQDVSQSLGECDGGWVALVGGDPMYDWIWIDQRGWVEFVVFGVVGQLCHSLCALHLLEKVQGEIDGHDACGPGYSRTTGQGVVWYLDRGGSCRGCKAYCRV